MARWKESVPRHCIHCDGSTVSHCRLGATTSKPLLFTLVGTLAIIIMV